MDIDRYEVVCDVMPEFNKQAAALVAQGFIPFGSPSYDMSRPVRVAQAFVHPRAKLPNEFVKRARRQGPEQYYEP